MSRPGFERIEGLAVDLIEIVPEYFEHVVRWRNSPENRRYFVSQTEFTLDGQTRWYDNYRGNPSDLTFIISLKTGQPIGMAALYSINERNGSAEFGRLLIGDAICQGKGLGLEATRLCLKTGFDSLRLDRVYLKVFDWNQRAVHVYERLGFTSRGVVDMDDGTGHRQPVREMSINCTAYRHTST